MPTTTYKAAAAIATLLIALVHLLIAPTVDLSVDEAHYGLYARFLDLSYFDHPPLVGWMLWLLTPLGLNEFTLRLPSALIYVTCCYLLYQISSRRIPSGSELTGLVTVLLFSLTPMVQLLGFGLVPEFPLLLWALLLAMLLDRAPSTAGPGFWLTLGVLFGLAGLTKYTAILLVPGLALYWLLQGQLLWAFKQRGLYLAIAVTLLVVSPVLIWNHLHDWASFDYQINHTTGGEWQLQEVLKAFAVQLVTYSPLIVLGGLVALRDIAKPGMRGLLACLAAPVLAFVLIGSGNGNSLPHWSLLGWTLLTPSVSLWLVKGWQHPRIRWLSYCGTGIATLLSITLLVLLAFKPLATTPWAAPALRDLSGWRQAAETASDLLDRHFPQQGVILVSNWSRASRIAWYAWPTTVQVLDDSPGQFVYWYGAVSSQTRGILIRDNLDDDDQPTTPYQKQGLHCEFLQQLSTAEDGVEVNRFYFYRCAGAIEGQTQTD